MNTDKPIAVLQKVMNWLNQDEVTSPKELYEEVFACLNQSPSLPIEQGGVEETARLILLQVNHNTESGKDDKFTIEEISDMIRRRILKPPPENSNARVIEYLKGKLEETSPYQSGGNYLIAHLKSWIKELEGKSKLQQ